MDVLRAKHAGACYGVGRALDLAQEASCAQGVVCTLGPLIHNPHVVESLERQGVFVAPDVDSVPDGATVVIRSHGVTPDVMRAVSAKAGEVIDATCPFVQRAQVGAEELAARCGCVLVVGESGHPEVEGLVARAKEAQAHVCVVSSVNDIPDDLPQPVGIVVQTTQRSENLNSVIDALRARGIAPEVKNTICTATRKRQDAAASLAQKVDAMVVIGGRNSSNTTRLAEICKARCAKSFHIESAEEIDPAWFEGVDTVGVTAGASTPDDQIKAVEDFLVTL